MAVKIRLQRFGRKRKPYYHIVVADSRAPRDGKFIERLGSYNPNTNPATIDIDMEKALHWINTGAQPTDTARAILSYKGIMYQKHLSRGVAKGAMTQEQADELFTQWTDKKVGQVDQKIEKLQSDAKVRYEARVGRENEVAQKKAEAIAAKNAPAPEVSEEAPNEEAPNEEAEAADTTEATEGSSEA